MPTPVKDVLFQVTASSVTPVPIIFPTTTVAKTQTTNGQVVIGPGAAATVLAANANRKFAQVVNVTGANFNVAMGIAAAATNLVVPNNGTWNADINTLGEMNQQAISVFNPGAAPITVYVYEE